MPNEGDSQFENLQFNPIELGDEVEKEVQEEAASDPDGHAALAAAVVDAAALPSPESLLRSQISLSDAPQSSVMFNDIRHQHTQRRPVVPFVKVRRLSDAEGMSIKRSATAAEGGPPTKKTKTDVIDDATSATENMPTPRMTRSRMKKAGPDAMAVGLSDKTRAKKESPVKAHATPQSPSALTLDKASKVSTNSKALQPEPVISDSVSVSGSVASAADIIEEAIESVLEVPMVTPVESEEAASAKHLVVANKVKHALLPLPMLPSSSDGRNSDSNTSQNWKAAALKAPAAALKEGAEGTGRSLTNKKAPARRSAKKFKAACIKESKTTELPPVAIDTSTAHIQALIGENGASVSLGVRNCTNLEGEELISSSSDTNAPVKNNGSSSAPLTEAQRAQQSRDRNRKHARNTRLRKKAYVEELKQTLHELVAQRDRSEVVQEQNRQRELEQREVRFRVMEEFLNLRGRNVADTKRWSAILMPPFTMTMPITSSFQEMVGTKSDGQLQKLVGVDDVMQDSRHFAAFLQTLGKCDGSDTNLVSLIFHCDRDDFIMDGCRAVLGWKASSVGADNMVS
jgi:hypothetical protein